MSSRPNLAKTAARGYGGSHQAKRAAIQRRMDRGETFNCWRCGLPVDPANWDLGHDDHDRTKYRGPEHPGRECPAGGNRQPLARRLAQKPADPEPRPWTS